MRVRKTLGLEGQHLHFTAKGTLAMSRRSKKHLHRWIRFSVKFVVPKLQSWFEKTLGVIERIAYYFTSSDPHRDIILWRANYFVFFF